MGSASLGVPHYLGDTMITTENIIKLIKEIDNDLDINNSDMDKPLSDIGVDSLLKMDLLLRIEEITSQTLTDDEIDSITSINNIVDIYKCK